MTIGSGASGVRGLAGEVLRFRRILRGRQAPKVLTGTVTVSIVGWAVASLFAERPGFAVFSFAAVHGVEAASALARLFGAVVIALFLAGENHGRLRWVAAGLVILGLGGLVFGYAGPLIGGPLDTKSAMYARLLVHILAATFLLAGLWPKKAPQLSRRRASCALAAFGAAVLITGLPEVSSALPPLTLVDNLWADGLEVHFSRDLTMWYWTLSALPLGMSTLAAWGAFRLHAREGLPGWLLFAAALFAGAQLHQLFWPSAYGDTTLTTADVLRFAFAAAVAGGALFELYGVSRERATLLAKAREHSRRLRDLQVIKADFTAMVAHELASPLLAARGYAEMLGPTVKECPEGTRALRCLTEQTDRIADLISDVRTSAAVERDDFNVEQRRVAVGTLLKEASSFAGTLCESHPVVVVDGSEGGEVWADPERIGQVLRNLLTNAAKCSSVSSPITLTARAGHGSDRLSLSVSDLGCGVRPEEESRIFEKFAHGRVEGRGAAPGAGLGLYVSRRIVRCHGGELTVDSTPEVGSTFSFDLAVAPVTRAASGRTGAGLVHQQETAGS